LTLSHFGVAKWRSSCLVWISCRRRKSVSGANCPKSQASSCCTAGLAAAAGIYGKAFNPEITLKALCYFEDGNLRALPDDMKLRLVTAARDVDLDHLPSIEAAAQPAVRDNGRAL
jgi:hypothetical protein